MKTYSHDFHYDKLGELKKGTRIRLTSRKYNMTTYAIVDKEYDEVDSASVGIVCIRPVDGKVFPHPRFDEEGRHAIEDGDTWTEIKLDHFESGLFEV